MRASPPIAAVSAFGEVEVFSNRETGPAVVADVAGTRIEAGLTRRTLNSIAEASIGGACVDTDCIFSTWREVTVESSLFTMLTLPSCLAVFAFGEVSIFTHGDTNTLMVTFKVGAGIITLLAALTLKRTEELMQYLGKMYMELCM